MQMSLATIVLLVCSAAFIANDLFIFKKSVLRSLQSTAKILGSNLIPAIAFGDKKEATKILASLQAEPTIKSAYVVDPHGELFASYGDQTKVVNSFSENETTQVKGSHVIFRYGLSENNESHGSLYLEADLKVFAA